MQFQQLSIESGDRTFTLELDPGMTVIAGVGRLEREGLIAELIGSLSTGRSGVHVEVSSDAGARFVVARPIGSPARIVAADQDRDVTELFTSDDGRVNILERAGLSVASATQAMRLTDADLTTKSQDEARLLRVAHVDQGRLWDVASKVEERQEDVERIATQVGSDPADAPMLAEIERRHTAFEQAEEGHEKARRTSLLIGANAAVLVTPMAVVIGLAAAVLAAVVALAATVYSFVHWQRTEQARREQQEALDAAGAKSYLAFQLNKVNGLLSNDRLRREMMRAAEYHRAALAEWHLLAGGVELDWAFAHRAEIRSAAARLRESVEVRNPMATTMSAREEISADLAHALMRRANQLSTIGAGGESFPLLVDEAFCNVEGAHTKADLLQLLERVSKHQQVIVLTEDADIVTWARSEATSHSIGLIEPAAPVEKSDEKPDNGNGHVAA